MQVRLATLSTSIAYVTGKLWLSAILRECPWHPKGGCGFCRHGSYERVRPPGTRVARWYCPVERRTISALPDCLASHYSGTLNELEATVCAVEQARSLAAAAEELRTEIELPGALRYLSRLCRAVHATLNVVRGLDPQRFSQVLPTVVDFSHAMDSPQVLTVVREQFAHYLPQLPTPVGFNPPRKALNQSPVSFPHRTGRDPPTAIIDAAYRAGRRPAQREVR